MTTETPARPLRTCAWCEDAHPENLTVPWSSAPLYFCSDGCIQEWAETA
jgi:hypothetical protein